MYKNQFSVGDLVVLRSPLGQKSPSNFGIIIEIHPDMGFGDSCRVYWDSGFQGAELLRSLEKLQ